MRTMVEQMITTIVMMILVFVFTIIISAGLQILNARLIHSSAIEQIQSSYYSVEENDLNKQIDSNWYFEIKPLNHVNNRRDEEVILHYKVYLPLFKTTGIDGTIIGYAR